jgi:hypothetical protein
VALCIFIATEESDMIRKCVGIPDNQKNLEALSEFVKLAEEHGSFWKAIKYLMNVEKMTETVVVLKESKG